MKLVFGSDHAGFSLRKKLVEWATQEGHEVLELGAQDESPYDYPDAADLVAKAVLSKEWDFGVLACGTGIGVAMSANRHKGIRAANCCTPEMAELSREHNHANILCLGGRLLDPQQALEILKAFLATGEDTAGRHSRRVQKLDQN
jgi:ribose 5-phosphate isomerase B